MLSTNFRCAGKVLVTYPTIAGEPRNYPAQGSSVMLPLDSADGFTKVTIMVCGGANDLAFSNPTVQYAASSTCGLLEATSATPQWTMLDMPFPRVLGDMILLPTGRPLIINGAQQGSAGWGFASNPAFSPLIFDPANHTFEVQAPSAIARMYHSTAVLLPDTRILCAGSNSHQFYTYTQPFPTELRVDAFSPQYLDGAFDSQRPTFVAAPNKVSLTRFLFHSYLLPLCCNAILHFASIGEIVAPSRVCGCYI